jgi:hypothetical protein
LGKKTRIGFQDSKIMCCKVYRGFEPRRKSKVVLRVLMALMAYQKSDILRYHFGILRFPPMGSQKSVNTLARTQCVWLACVQTSEQSEQNLLSQRPFHRWVIDSTTW